MTDTASILLQRAIVESKSQWETMVYLALATPEERLDSVSESLSVAANVGPDSIKRKLTAIQYQHTLGFSDVDIVAMGQEKVLGGFIKKRKQDNYQQTVSTRWQLPGSLKELFEQDMRRIMGVLGIYTTVEFFDWLHAQLETLTEEEIKQSAGGEDGSIPAER